MESDPESVSDGYAPKLTTRPFLFEVVKRSEQLRSVISVWLGTVTVGFESYSAPSGEK